MLDMTCIECCSDYKRNGCERELRQCSLFRGREGGREVTRTALRRLGFHFMVGCFTCGARVTNLPRGWVPAKNNLEKISSSFSGHAVVAWSRSQP